MANYGTRGFHVERMRIGQRMAVVKILERIEERSHYVAIVLPTRYGKSDVMRMSACEAISSGMACSALILSPGLDLAQQMVMEEKIRDMEARYDPSYSGLVRKVSRVTSLIRPNANGEWILSATIQYVQRNMDIFAAWVRSEVGKTGLPVLVYYDEAHTASTTNEWGKVAKCLRQSGAIVILLTATPWRETGRIEGFQCETVSQETFRKYITKDGKCPEMLCLETYEGTRTEIKLVADYEYGLSSEGGAWGEDPLPIAKLDFIPFQVRLNKFMDGEADAGEDLNSLSESTARRILGKVVRDPQTIAAGCAQFVEKLSSLKNIDSCIQGIIFAGNDQPDDPGNDKHLKAIHAEMKRCAPALRGGISTTASDEEEEDDQLNKLRAGEIDYLIVKNRGGVGLDIARLKVLLDLSPVRTPAAYLQRLMRVATVYKGLVGIVIAPKEKVGEALFNRFIKDEGGHASFTEMTLLRSEEILRKDKQPLPYYSVDGTGDADFGDSDGRWAEGQLRRSVDALFAALPGMIGHVTHASVAEVIKGGVLQVNMLAERKRDIPIDQEKELLRTAIVERHKQAVGKYQAFNKLDKTSYGASAKKLWDVAYARAGIGEFVELSQQNDVNKLRRLKEAFDKMLSRIDPSQVEEVTEVKSTRSSPY